MARIDEMKKHSLSFTAYEWGIITGALSRMAREDPDMQDIANRIIDKILVLTNKFER